MLTSWEGGCYALLTVKMSSKCLVNLQSKIGDVAALFCCPVELLKCRLLLLPKHWLAVQWNTGFTH